MILVIGGAHQGKLRQVLDWLQAGEASRELYADGTCDSLEAALQKPVVYGVQAYLARCQTEHLDAKQWLDKLIEQNPDYVIMDEVGYGVVPIDAQQREYRELAGRAGQQLAREAECVYRIICGIPVRIKG